MRMICLAIFLFISVFHEAKCQTSKCDTCTYAIGYMYKTIDAFGVEWDNGSRYDLDVAFKMKQPWNDFENDPKKYKFALFAFMDKLGYVLVTATVSHGNNGILYAYEWVFRKKELK